MRKFTHVFHFILLLNLFVLAEFASAKDDTPKVQIKIADKIIEGEKYMELIETSYSALRGAIILNSDSLYESQGIEAPEFNAYSLRVGALVNTKHKNFENEQDRLDRLSDLGLNSILIFDHLKIVETKEYLNSIDYLRTKIHTLVWVLNEKLQAALRESKEKFDQEKLKALLVKLENFRYRSRSDVVGRVK